MKVIPIASIHRNIMNKDRLPQTRPLLLDLRSHC